MALFAHVWLMASPQQWFETLRLSIQQEHGKGWSVREIGATKRNPIGRCRLTRMYEDGSRSSVVMPLEWKATDATAIFATVSKLRTLIEEHKSSCLGTAVTSAGAGRSNGMKCQAPWKCAQG